MRVNPAAVLNGPRSLTVASQPLPEVGAPAVRIRLQGCGECGSNLPAWEGASFLKVKGSFYDFVAEPLDAWSGGVAVAGAQRLGLSPRFNPTVPPFVSVAETLGQLYGRSPS